MTIDSTHQTLHQENKTSNMKVPRIESLQFIRQFARTYCFFNDLRASAMIMN